MKVLHVIPSLSIRRGGPSVSLRQLAKAQRQSGVEAAVLTTNDDCEDNADWPLGRWFEIEGVPVMAFERRRSSLRWLHEHLFSPSALHWLDRELDQWPLLHVHAVFSHLSTGAMRLARRRGHPYICRPLGQLCSWSLSQKGLKKQVYLRLLECANLAAANRIHFTSEKEHEEFASLGIAANPMVVPHGIHLPPERADKVADPEGPCNILSLSRIDEKKGLDLLLHGFARVLQRLPAARLVIAGSGDPACEAGLRQLAVQLGVADRVRFTGWVAGDEKQNLLDQADVFVLASHSENFGVAVVEALASGVPVLVTEGVALCNDVLDYEAGLEIGYEPEDIAARLVDILDQPALARRLSANARRLARERYSWPGTVAAISQHYHEIVSEHES